MVEHGELNARRAEVAALPRPSVIGTSVGQAMKDAAYVETTDTQRVYARDWIITHAGTQEECEAAFQERYEGRVLDSEWRVAASLLPEIYYLQLWVPNLLGEFKTRHLAEEFAASFKTQEPVIVTRNSRDEHLLKDYGVKKLVARG